MPFEDKELICQDCGQAFIFSASEQEFFSQKNFSEPRRCRNCRRSRRSQKNGGQPDQADRPSFEVQCADCGQTTTVPFEPKSGRPVYCRDCFEAHRKHGH